MNSKVVNPDNKYKDIDWQYPEHENEDRMDVVVEIIMGVRFLYSVVSSTSCQPTGETRMMLT